MISHAQSHCWRPMAIAMHAVVPKRQAQGAMSSMKIVIKELQTHQCIPRRVALGKRMRLTSEGTQPITQRSIEPLHMHGPGWSHADAQCGTDLHRQEVSMLITMFDRLQQRYRLWDHQRRTPALARQHALTIGSPQDAGIPMPSIAQPSERAMMGSLDRRVHRLRNQILAEWAGGIGDHEATVPVLDQASPAFSLVRLSPCALFFCTNDQNSSISTWLRCRSLARTWVSASAWVAARLSHTLMVSYLCPVISSAARRLPRRMTIKRAWATSAAGVFNPYIGVPCVSPKYVLQVRHRYRCRPRWLPFRTTRDCEHVGLGQMGRLLCSFLSRWFMFHLLSSLLSPPSRVTTPFSAKKMDDEFPFVPWHLPPQERYEPRRFWLDRTLKAKFDD